MLVPRRVWIAALGAFASSPIMADDASRLAAAREIVAVTHAADNMKALLPQIMNAVRPMLAKQGADQKTIDELLKDGETRMSAQTGQLVDLMAEIYAQEFSEEDLTDLLAFDKAPAGERLIEKQATLMRGMLAIGQRWGQLVAKQVIDDFTKRRAGSTDLTP